MNNDNLRNLYKTFQKEGYEMPSYEEFEKDMQDDSNLHDAWESLKNDGYEPPEYETFKTDMWPSQETVQVPVNDGVDGDESVTPTLPSSEGEYSQEVIDRYNSPDNKAGNFKDMAQIAAEVEREKQGGLFNNVWNGIKKGGSNLIGNIMGVFKPIAQQVPQVQAQPSQAPLVPPSRGKNGSPTPTLPSKEEDGGGELMGRFREFVKNGHNDVGTPLKQMEVELLASGAAETPEDAIKKAYELNWLYADESASGIAKKTVEGIPHGFQDIGVSLDNAYYTREMQDEIKRSADSLGISYDDYVKNHLKPQIGVALRDRFGYSERDADTIARRLFGHEEHATDRVIMDEANELTGGWLGEAVNKEFADFDAKADETYQRNYTYNPTAGAANIGSHLFAQREANKESDPDKVLESLKGKAKGIFDSLLSNKEYMAEVSKKAAEEGMTPEAYIEQYVAPGFVDALQRKFQDTAVAREMPSSKLEYVLGGFGDSIIGMLTNSYLNSEGRQQYINEANALTAMGKNPNIGEPGILAEGSRLAAGMAADFWLWGGWGKIGARATGELVGQRIASVAAQRGVSKEVARRLVEEEAAHHLGKRVAKNIMEHVPQSAITMAGAEGTTEAVRSARDGEGFLTGVGNTISTALHGGLTGSAFGLTGGFMGGLTQRLSGAKRLAGKLAGLEVEAATLYTTEELSKMAQGEEAFNSPFEGLVESNIKLGFIKASANPLVTGAKLIDAIKNPVKAVKNGMKGNTGTLTDEDVRDLTSTSSGENLMDALTAMRPERTEKGMGGREGYVSREAAQKGAEAYEQYMTDPDRPFDRKQRVARLLGGIIPPPGLEVKAEVTPEEDGSYVLRTRDIDGQCVREMRFDTQEEVDDAIVQMQYDIDRNQTEALEQKVNLYDAYQNYSTYLADEYERAAIKLSNGEELSDGERQAVYLHQHRGDLLDIAEKRANGRELTDEEKQLGEIYEERFNDYAKDNDTTKEFAKKFEEENDLPEGALQAAIEGHSFDEAKKLEEEYVANGGTPDLTSGRVGNGTWRTSAETQIVNAYRDALRKQIESYEKNESISPDPSPEERGEVTQVPLLMGDGVDGESPVIASTGHYGRGQEAVKANDAVALREIGHEVDLADARIGSLFTKEEAQKIYDIVENGTEEDVSAMIEQEADAAKRDAIQKLHDATEAMRGIDDGISEGALADEEAIRAEMTALQSESGEIIPLELSNGTTVYLKSGNPENRYGTVMVSYPGDDGEVHHAQLNVHDIESIGEAVPTEEFIAQRSQQLRQENEGRYRDWVNGTELRTGNQVELTTGGQTGTFTVDGFFGNGDVQLHDETGGVMRVSRDEAMQMIRATEDKRITEELETERKAYQEAERQRKEAEKAEAERQQREVEERKKHLGSLSPTLPSREGEGKDGRWSQLGDTGISLSDKEGVEKHLAATYPTEEEARSFIEDQRRALKVHQRDDIQPRIDALKGLLDDYVYGKREYTDEELGNMVTSLSDLETEQAFLNEQAKSLKGIQESLKTPQSPLLRGAAGRMSALSKARSREDKIRIGRELYGSDDVAGSLFDDLDIPRDAYELVSMNLGYGSINWEGFERGGRHVRGLQEELGVSRGIGRGKDSNGFNAYLAKKGEGKGVEDIVHAIWESPENELPDGGKRFDDSEIRNAMLDLLMSASKPTDIRDYVIDQRLNEAEAVMRETEDREAEYEMAEWSKAHHLLPEERESYEAAVLERLKEYSSLSDDDIQKINAIFAESFENGEDYEQNRRSQEMDRQPVARGTGGEGEGGEGEIRQQGTSEDGLEDHGERRAAGDEVAAVDQPVSDRNVSNGDGLETPQAPLFRGDDESLSPTLPRREEERRNSVIQGLDGYTEDDVKSLVENHFNEVLDGADARIVDMRVIGSRTTGKAREDSDLDVLLEYEGKEREDDLFNALNDEDNRLYIEGIPVDINPITKGKSGTIAEFLKRNEAPLAPQAPLVPPSRGKDESLSPTLPRREGDFGPVYEQFRGKPKEAIAYLRETKDGVAKNALHHKDIGDIDLVWGDTKRGLEHIDSKHPEITDNLQEILDTMTIAKSSDNRIVLENETHKAIVSKDWYGKPVDNWLLTAYEKKEGVSGGSIDIVPEPEGKQNGTAPLQNASSVGKVTENISNLQGNGVKSFSERLSKAIEETNTEPTEGQKEAGNYKKGHLSFGGYNFTVENPKGSVRIGKDANGKPWSITMHNTYGYLTGKGHLGKDGDHLDVFINDDANLDNFDGKIYIIDQVNKDGSFDEHKIMWGFNSEVDAIRNYLLNYSRPWHGLGNITGVDKATFDKWVESSERKVKPFAETRFGDSRDVASKVIEGIAGKNVPVLDKGDYRTYMTPEAKEHFANDPRFAKLAHRELAFVTAAVWDGVVIPVEELAKIPEIVEAEQRVKAKEQMEPFTITDEQVEDYAKQLLDIGSAVYENGKMKKVDGKDDFSGPVKQERKAFVIIGRPAGGKSSVFANPLSNQHGARIIDSDVVKEWFTEFDDGYGAGYVQGMSGKVADRAMEIAVRNGDNIVLPRIGGASVIREAVALRAMGYDVQLYYNDVAPETSYMRSNSRFAMTGRFLSLDYLTSIKDKPSKNFSKFAEKTIGEYIDECTEEEVQKLRGRIGSLAGSQQSDLQRALPWSLDGEGRSDGDGGVSGNVERSELDGTTSRIGRESSIFSYAEWKSNDVAFGEKPKEIWNSESGEPLPGKTEKGEPKVEVSAAPSVDQGERIKQTERLQGKYEITKRFHKKKGTDIDVVNFTERFDREKFLELKKTVKDFGGYYSSYGRGGFVFENGEDAARRFAEAVTGDAEAPVVDQRTEPKEEIHAKQAKADRETVVEALGKRYVRTDEEGNDATLHVKYIGDEQVEVEITSSNPDIEPTTERVSIEDVARSLRQGDWEEVKPHESGKRFPEDGEAQMKEAINELHDAYKNGDIAARAKAYRKMWDLFDARQEDEGVDLRTRRKNWYDYKKTVHQQFITEKNNEQTTEATSGTGEAVVPGRDDVLGVDASGVDGGLRPEGTGGVVTGGEPERKPSSNRGKSSRNGRKSSEAGQQLSLFGDWGDGTGDASGAVRSESGTRGEDLGGPGAGGSRPDRGRGLAKKEGTGEEVAIISQQTELAQNGTELAQNGTELAQNGTKPTKNGTEPEKKDLTNRADDGSAKTATEKARPLNTRNYLYPKDASDIDNMSPRERLNANVRALEILRDLMRENRPGTPEEIAEMGRFRGWGGIKDVESFYNVDWLRRMDRRVGDGIYGRLADVIDELDPDGKRGLLDNIRRSALTSYYTPTDIARAINHFLDKAGFKGGDFLDGSYGVGVLEGTMPKGMQQRTQIHGVELDWLTGQLAKHLYPDADIKVMGFQDVDIADNSMDVVGSNIPFGDIEVFDKKWKNNSDPTHKIAQKRIHNYYVVSKIDKTKPGGLLYIMTSNAVMDTPGNKLIREYIADQCEILGAVRLPDNTFKGAGTKVVTDVLFLRKFKDAEDRANTLNGRNGNYESDVLKPFLGTAQKEIVVEGAFRTVNVNVKFNGYYGAHPEMMLGDVKAGGQYRGDEFGLTSDMSTSELARQMEKLIDKKIVGERAGKLLDTHRTERKVMEAVRESYVGDGNFVSNGNLIEQNGRLGVLETQRGEGGDIIRQFVELPGLKKDAAKIKTMIPLRTALKKLISEEIGGADDATLSALRSDLRKAYEQYARKYGKLHDKGSNYLDNDIDGFTLRSLEKWKDGKFIGLSDIFEKSTIKPKIDASTIKTPSEAVTVSLAEYGEIRESFLRERLGDNWQEQCEGVVFAVPFRNGRYEIRDLYLSGDVKSKLADAERAAAKDPSYQKNVDALKEVQPKDIPFIGIGIHMGARWVPEKVYTEFIWDLLGVDGVYGSDGANRSTGIRYLPEADVFTVSVSPWETSGKANEWHTTHRKAEDLIDCALKNDKTKVQYTIDGKSVFDAKETEQANDKIQQIREKFEEWLPQNRERVEELAKIYNDKFNRTVIPHFDGSHLQVPGLQGMELRPHQKDAVWMLINNRGGIIDHIVGAGKTLVMQCAIMEMRRMGIAKKPMIIALKSTVPQIKKEFLEAFPAARVLAPSEKDFTTKNRKKILSQIALNDWDCVILSHENYGMLPHTEEVETGVIREQLDQLDASIHLLMEQRDQSDMTKRQKKALEKRRQRLENKMSKLLDRKVDREFTFENLGVDYLFVDECQQFKSLPYTTTHQNVAGLASPEGSSRATALLCGARYLQQLHQGDMGVTLLSGTTISNSLVELYSLLQYVRPNKMASLGFNTFDAWASNFAVNSAELEYNHLNELATRSRFRNFDNLPELSKLYTEVADVRNDNNLELPKPKMKVHVVTVPATNALSKITDECIKMCKQKDGSYFGIPSKTASGKDQPWSLLATNISTKAAINVRLVDPSLEDVDGGKIKMVCDNVKALYDKFSPWKGTQMIFCDLGVPGEGKEYDVYNDIIRRLTTEYGIPREEIVDIHVANTDKKKEELFKKMNNGDVRVLIAGAKNGGTGVNVQQRMVGIHHVDMSWNPANITQENGRGARQGNWLAKEQNDNQVEVFYYATENSLDLYKYQLVDQKQKMIDRFKTSTTGDEREFKEEAGEDSDFDAAAVVAMLSGNPIILEKAKQDKKVEKLIRAKRQYDIEYDQRKHQYESDQRTLANFERLVTRNAEDRKVLAENGFVPDKKGVYPATVKVVAVVQQQTGPISKTFEKPGEAGQFIHELMKNNAKVQLEGFGMVADIVFEVGGELFGTKVVLRSPSGIRYDVDLSDSDVAAGTSLRRLLQKVVDNADKYAAAVEQYKHKLEGGDPGEKNWPKQSELDEALAKKKELDEEYKKLQPEEETPQAPLSRGDDGTDVVGEPDVVMEYRRRRRAPKVVSHMEGSLFGEVEREGELFDGKNETPPQPIPEGREKDLNNQIVKMSDGDLLKEISSLTDKDRDFYVEEYDKRHREDYNESVSSYLEMLENDNTSLDDAYSMYNEVAKLWKDGGYATDERSKLMGQIDALEEYVTQKEVEIMEREDAEAAVVQQQTEPSKRYEEQKAVVREHGYDLTKLRLRDLADGELSRVERRYVENGSFSFTSGEHVESAADIAYIFRQLEDAAVENSFMVLVKDGVPTVIHLAIGSYNGVMAPIEQAFVAYKEINPDSVVFVHNHPSGRLKASREDVALQAKVEALFGSKAMPAIIINTKSGKYAEFTGGATFSQTSWEGKRPDSIEGEEVPVRVFNFSKQVFDKDWNPETAFKVLDLSNIAAYVSSHRLGEHKKMSLIVLDQAGHITGNIFLPWTSTTELSKRDNALQIATYINQMGGRSAVVYGNCKVDDSHAVQMLSKYLKVHNVSLMDVLTIEGSAYEKGLLYEPEVEYKGSAKEMMEATPNEPETEQWTLSDKRMQNGEQFYQDANGNIDLVDIPEEVFNHIGYTKAPLRLTPSMLKHVQKQHGKETKITNDQEAIGFIKDVMRNFDHVRLGNDGALVFSVENGRQKTGKRAITILLNSDNGEFYGIKTSGYESVDRLSKRPLLWEGSAVITPSTDTATEPVTSLDAQQGGEQSGSASGQSGLSESKDTKNSDTLQENSKKYDYRLPAENIEFSVRTDEAPKKTGIGYKVFVLKDGKLYPPMVANPGGKDTPTGVWLDADAAPIAGTSKTGRLQVKAGGKGTQGGSGQLAYRPGWHLGEIPYALQFNRINPETGEKELFPKNFVWAEVEYANDVDYQQEAMSYGYNKNGKFQHSLAGLPRLPKDGSYRYRTNPNPETDPWIITGAMKVKRLLTPSEVDDMVRRAGRNPQPRQEGAITDEQVEQVNRRIAFQGDREEKVEELATQAVMKVLDDTGVPYHVISQDEAQRVLAMAKSFYNTKIPQLFETSKDLLEKYAGMEPLITSKGIVYGFTDGKDVYLTDEGINPETPAHEYGHLWVKAVKAQRPDLWENIKSLMKEDEVSQKIYQKLLGDDNYQKIHGDEDELYEEVLTNMSGQKNRERFEQAAREVLDEAESMDETMKIAKVIAKIRSALSKLWHWIGKDLFKIKKFRSVDEVTDRMMYDFVEGTELPRDGVNGSNRANMEFQVGKGKPRQKKGEGMASYFERLRAWERRKLAEEDENDPMPVMPEMEGIEDFDEMARIQKEYKKLYEDWEVRHGLRDIANAELGLYDVATGKAPLDPPSRGKEGDEVLREQEIDARVMQDLGDATGFDTTPEGARKQVKYAVINRRKNLESSNAEDAIFVHDLGKRIDDIAKHQGVTSKELREALPHLIEDTYGYDRVHMDDGSIEIVDVRDQMPIKKTAEVARLLSDIKDWYDEFYHVLEDAGLREDAGYIAEGYVNHIWDKAKSDPKAWEEYVENYQRTKSPNMKHREIPTYAEGIDVGLVPKFTDIIDIMSYYSRSNNEAVANRKLLDDLACINVDETNASGEVTRTLPLLSSVEPSYFDKDAYSKPYEVPGVGNVWVHKAAQHRFASVFGSLRQSDIPDWLTKTARALDTTASTMKKIQLSFSGFHAGALTEVAIAQMRPDRAMKALFKYIILDSIKQNTLPAYAHPEDFKFAAKHLVNLGATADYAAADVNMITEKLHQAVVDFKNEHKNLGTESAALVTAVLDYMNKGMDKVLWNYIHDGFKIACFKMFAEQIDRRLLKIKDERLKMKDGESREEMRERLLDEAGQYVNDSFGGQYWELLGVTPAELKWLRRFFLSPDWLVSTQRHFLANFGFGSLYNEGNFLEYMRYNRDNLKRAFGADIPRNEYRRFRSKNAKQCYLLGVCGFFYIMMNAINALYRKKDEADEREKADEIRKSVPNYRSSYELAYPDGMKWYDYTMYGNTIGQQTHLFLGRYKDGSEWYARWGKQFREFPELFMGRHGVEFPAPMIERMIGKSNPMISYLIDGLGTLDAHGFEIPYQEKETIEKYGKTIGFLSMTAKHFLPFSVPTQAEKEFKTWDLVMPSQKGFTRWKAVDFFKTYINAGDMHGIERTYHAAVMNGLNAEECLDAAISSVKATQRKELADGVTDLQSAFEKFDGATTLSARQQMRKKIIQYLASEDYKAYSRADALEKARSFMEGEDVAKVQKDNDKYVMSATSEDIRDDWKMDALYKKSGEMKKQLHELEDSGKDTRRWEKAFGAWLDVRDILNDYRKEVKSLKKQLGEGRDEAVMKEIRQLRKKTAEAIDKLSPPESPQ